MPKKEKSTFSHFFREDAENIQGVLKGEAVEQTLNEKGVIGQKGLPRIEAATEVAETEFIAFWQRLRSFFRNADHKEKLPEDLWPVLMSPYFSENLVATDFPIWVAVEHFDDGDDPCLSLKDIIDQALSKLRTDDTDFPIIKQQKERIIHLANEYLADRKPHSFQTAILQILGEFEKQLEVSGEERQTFSNNLKRLKEALPKHGALLPYSNDIPFQKLELAIQVTLVPARNKLKQELSILKSNLEDLLRIDREKGPERRDPEKLHESLSFVDSLLNFDELTSILPEAGSELLGEQRVRRIKTVLRDLDQMASIFDRHGFLFVDQLLFEQTDIDWKSQFENVELEICHPGMGYDALTFTFEKQIATWVQLFKALRIGKLELENRYQAQVHDDFFNHFTWQNLSREELNACPYFLMIVEDAQAFEAGFNQLSKLLSDNIPVKILAIRRNNEQSRSGDGAIEKASLHAPAELGALMLTFKNIYVSQTAAISPQDLFNSFKEGLTSFAPAFFHVLNMDGQVSDNPYIRASAAIESRDFPGFTFQGLLGTPWGSRFNIENNPQPESAWPVHLLQIIDEQGAETQMEFHFTFADFAVSNPAYHHYFLPVKASFWNEDLIPLTRYLKNSTEDNIGKVPFIWMMDKANELHKVAVSWPLVIATQERLDFWRLLQENSGINNYHVAKAVVEAQAEMKAVHDFEIEQLKKEQELEIQKIRDEEAEKVMENLTSVLLDLDTSSVLDKGISVSDRPQISLPQEKHEEPEGENPPESITEEEIVLSNEAYIDTPLCTTCNECINLNGALFKYNADKLAYIADASAGTFKELVEAAEMCPVAIIHPGSPLNPGEPGLEDLIKRAEKFN